MVIKDEQRDGRTSSGYSSPTSVPVGCGPNDTFANIAIIAVCAGILTVVSAILTYKTDAINSSPERCGDAFGYNTTHQCHHPGSQTLSSLSHSIWQKRSYCGPLRPHR